MTASLEAALALDAADPLAGFRRRFHLPRGVIYLDGNSLGPLPRAAARKLLRAARREWGEGLIRSWNEAAWIEAPGRVGGKIAALVGAAPDEVIVADSTSANLFKLLAAAVQAAPGRREIVTESGDFPTDSYIAQGICRLFEDVRVVRAGREEIAARLTGDSAVLLLSHVHYKTAQRHDMARLTAAAHAAGAVVIWDLSHSVGAVRIDLSGCHADLAVGCGYKFLNGGPGAPAFLYVAKRHQRRLISPLSGWMGHARPFAFEEDWDEAEGMTRFLCGTPPILALAALEAGVDLAREADLRQVETKSAALFDLFAALVEKRLGNAGFVLLSPRSAEARGSHIAFTHAHAFAIMQALIARGVIGDFRAPDVLRFGLTPLYLRYEDVWGAVESLAQVMESGAWRRVPPPRIGQVT